MLHDAARTPSFPPLVQHLVAVFLMAALGASAAAAQSARGCWRADRPLGPTGGATPVERDTRFNTFALRDSGRVVLPLLAERERRFWEDASWWAERGDTVELRVFSGLNGWHARMTAVPVSRSFRGAARYLTDVVMKDAAPLEVAVTLTAITCEAGWPANTTSRPSAIRR